MASPHPVLIAEYSSPTAASHFFAQKFSASPQNSSTEERTVALSGLRTAIGKLQDEVNVFLTQKMEEDKREAGNPAETAIEAKEEENYGEELVEDDG
jgi:hypothetical protein